MLDEIQPRHREHEHDHPFDADSGASLSAQPHTSASAMARKIMVADRLTDTGEALLRTGSVAEAVRSFRDAVNQSPRHLRACTMLACALELAGPRAEATEAWLGVGAALEARDQFEAAVDTYRKVIARKPDCARALNKLGWVLLKLAKPDEAVRCFEAVLAIEPDNGQVHKRLGCAALMANDEARGWQEWGWNDGLRGRHRFEQPMWDGGPLQGRTILAWADFALGDTIQCLRYLPLLNELGGRVVVETQTALLPLVQRMPGVAEVVVSGAPLPAFDVHAPLLSLLTWPAFQRHRLGAGLPYLNVADDLIAHWRDRLTASGRKAGVLDRSRTIGLTWSGSPTGSNARYRFTNLSSFAPLAAVPDARFISLQLGPRAADVVSPPPGLQIETLLDEFCTGADTAALMMNLDLIVTIDSMVAHLAGALGRPVWTVAWRSPAWWLWQVEDQHSLWYPTMRIFQQKTAGDWTEALARVRDALS